MKKRFLGLLLAISSTQAVAHDGHGVDANAVMHYFSAPHLLLPIGIGLCAAGLGFVVYKYLRQRQ